jgi:hypothetical protein
MALDIESFPIIPELGPWSPGPGPGNRSAIRIAVGGLRPRRHRLVEVDRPDPPARMPTLPPRSSGSRRQQPGSGCLRLPQWLRTELPVPRGHQRVSWRQDRRRPALLSEILQPIQRCGLIQADDYGQTD